MKAFIEGFVQIPCGHWELWGTGKELVPAAQELPCSGGAAVTALTANLGWQALTGSKPALNLQISHCKAAPAGTHFIKTSPALKNKVKIKYNSITKIPPQFLLNSV